MSVPSFEDLIQERFVQALDLILALIPDKDKPGRVISVAPGNNVAWDDCCEGQLTARLSSLVPVLGNESTIGPCGIKFWRATGEIMILHCAASLDDNGRAPTSQILAAEGYNGLQDTARIIRVLTSLDWVKTISSWVPQGPNGTCRGVAVYFTFNMDNPTNLEISE